LLDIDNLFSAFENAIDELFEDEEEYDFLDIMEVKEYHSEKDTIFRKTFLDTSGIGY